MIFIFFIAIAAGLGAIAWLFMQKGPQSEKSKTPTVEPVATLADDKSAHLLNRLGLDTDGKPDTSSPTLSFLKESAKEKTPGGDISPVSPPPQGPQVTADLKEGGLDSEITISSDPELIAKIENLEKQLKEKSEEIERLKKDINEEIKSRKESNKSKDAQEKDLKDSKDRNHKLQLELTASQAEVATYKARISQLEEKNNSKDKIIKQKEQEIDDLVKRMQAFATPAKPAQQPAPEPSQPTTPVAEPQPQIAEPQKGVVIETPSSALSPEKAQEIIKEESLQEKTEPAKASEKTEPTKASEKASEKIEVSSESGNKEGPQKILDAIETKPAESKPDPESIKPQENIQQPKLSESESEDQPLPLKLPDDLKKPIVPLISENEEKTEKPKSEPEKKPSQGEPIRQPPRPH